MTCAVAVAIKLPGSSARHVGNDNEAQPQRLSTLPFLRTAATIMHSFVLVMVPVRSVFDQIRGLIERNADAHGGCCSAECEHGLWHGSGRVVGPSH